LTFNASYRDLPITRCEGVVSCHAIGGPGRHGQIEIP
jgi:hypothetical protein